MTQAVKKVLDEIEALPAQERAELLAELFRRAASTPHKLPTDDDLVVAADELFAELDRRERA